MTAFTQTTIANLALAHLGDHRINNYDTDTGNNIKKIRDQWDIVRLEALGAYEWGFASIIAELNRSSYTPVAEYEYAYDKPADWIRTNAIAPTSEFDRLTPFRDWADKDGRVWTDEERVFMDYVYDHTTVGAWPHYFVVYVSASLAMAINPGITTSKSTGQQLADIRLRALAMAKARSAQTQPIHRPPPGRWLRARRGRGLTWR